tara:strand:+ start:306 stop:527 length:222 start_codon:yes stop_codon:yes gene_type:complete
MDHNYKDILHNVNLTEGQIGVILCALENSTKYADSDYIAEVDTIFEELEGTVDRFYDKMEKAQAKQPVAEWTD